MARKNYSLFHSSMQKLAASPPGAWFFSRTQHHFDRVILKLTNNKATMTSILAGLPVVILTSTGAKSGLPRKAPLLCIQDDSDPNKIAVIATNWGQSHYPAWYYNLKANPRATGLISGHNGDYSVHEAEGDEYDKFWQLAADTYIGYPLYKKRINNRHIPIMILTLIEA
ncbi:MAG: nitroreductase family deazaflavin-dependent oxidoreductase [Anaerolineae bacterium]